MKWVFWMATSLIIYTYLGYPAWLWVRARWHSRAICRGPALPAVSIVMAVRNEASALQEKLRNLAELDYSSDLLEVIIVSDGSTDGTEAILRAHAGPRVRLLLLSSHQGKASALDRAIAAAAHEIVVFTDVRQMIAKDAIRRLVENFADPSVGCVSGELLLGASGTSESRQGMGLYWTVEKKVREWESASGSVVGATGALYAVRRALLVPIPAGTILDDVYIPMHVVRQGARVVLDRRAVANDSPDLGAGREFRRKVRTLTGNYQLLQLAPWLLTGSNPLRFEFISHKLSRLVMPFALGTVLVAAGLLNAGIYRAAFIAQLAFYGLALLATIRAIRGPFARIAQAALTFVVLNTAALLAFVNFVGRRKAIWAR